MILETTSEDYAALCAGRAPGHWQLADTAIAPAEVIEMLAEIAESVRQTFSPVSWLILEDGELVGLCSLTRPPISGIIDIGYGIAPSRQGRGFAKGAVRAIAAWACRAPHVSAITADTAFDNFASQRVLQSSGFRKVGERMDDEDGHLYCWHYPTK
jgi:RimJ/RimL family protein N-acetyltransferase